jgi:hypothetical protein
MLPIVTMVNAPKWDPKASGLAASRPPEPFIFLGGGVGKGGLVMLVVVMWVAVLMIVDRCRSNGLNKLKTKQIKTTTHPHTMKLRQTTTNALQR